MIIDMSEKGIDIQVKKIEKLKNTYNFKDLEKMIIPFLADGPLFDQTWQETYEEFASYLDEDEARAAADEEHPNAVTLKWKGFTVAFGIDWGKTMPQIKNLGFFTEEMMIRTGVSVETLRIASLKSMHATRVAMKMMTLFGEPVMTVWLDTQCIPSWSCSAIISNAFIDKATETFETDTAIVIPAFREMTIVAPEGFNRRTEEVRDEVIRVTKAPWAPFTDRRFKFDPINGLREI